MVGMIDFGDAIVGDLMFELIPLHLDAFRCNKSLLLAFVESYGLTEKLNADGSKKLMNWCLLHPFNVMAGIFERHPEIGCLANLEDVAAWLWQIE